MERRRAPRISVDQPVVVTLLSDPHQPRFEATAVDLSRCGLRLRMPCAVALGTAVKVEAVDMLLLGEVCRSVPEDGAHTVALELCHSLLDLPTLERLNRHLGIEAENAGDHAPGRATYPERRGG